MGERHPSLFSPQKKNFALKRIDGVPLTRFDIQYDVLHYIFRDTRNVFTDPYPPNDAVASKICFRDLYLKTVINSPKATKSLKDKMNDSQTFAEDFSMLALLVNVGRVNTTMSFFPEMKTTIRTYHPIPSLQRTTGNLQDAPRIKHILKAAALMNDNGTATSTPTEILSQARSGKIPSTTVTNLIFVLANHSTPIGHVHFSSSFDFSDIFLRDNISSVSRARIFLWLCYHYLECPRTSEDNISSSANPFLDNTLGDEPPPVIFLSEDESSLENVDPREEKVLAEKLVAQRTEIMKIQGSKETIGQGSSRSTIGEQGKKHNCVAEESKPKIPPVNLKSNITTEERATVLPTIPMEDKADIKTDHDTHLELTKGPDSRDLYLSQRRHQNNYRQQQDSKPQRRAHALRSTRASPEPAWSWSHHRRRYSPFPQGFLAPASSLGQRRSHHVSPPAPRSMLQQAWHIITTTDPLLDSDEEDADEHIRFDYVRRLQVINALRTKEPTSEIESHLVTV